MRALLLVTVLAFLAAPAAAQPYALPWSTTSGGGATALPSSGGTYTLGSTVGDVAPGRASGATFTVRGGFWAPLGSATPLPTTYTVDPSLPASAANYASLEAAAADLTSGTRPDGGPANFPSGVTSPVVIEVADANGGIYDLAAPLVIGAIPGTSEVNTVAFVGATGNADDIVIQFTATPDTGDEPVIRLEGTSHIAFRDLTLRQRSTSGNQNLVLYLDDAAPVTVDGVTLEHRGPSGELVYYTSGPVVNAHVVVRIGSSTLPDVTIQNSRMLGGGFGLATSQSGSAEASRVVIAGNEIDAAGGVILTSVQEAIVEGNRITARTREGIRGLRLREDSRITGNVVVARNNTGISLRDVNGTNPTRLLVANNAVEASRSDAFGFALYLFESTFVDVFNNTFRRADANGPAVRLQNQLDQSRFANNVIASDGGVALQTIQQALDSFALDFTGYSNEGGGTLIDAEGTGYATLADWQAASPYDGNSLEADPVFAAPDAPDADALDLAPTNAFYLTGGTTFFDGVDILSLVPVDVTGTPRAAPLALGAYEEGSSTGGSGDPPLLATPSTDPVRSGDVFTVEVAVGSGETPVTDLFGIGLELSYDPTLLQFDDAAPGPFLDADPDNLVFFAQTDTPGTADVSVSRRADITTSGVDGSGTVVTLTFTVLSPEDEVTTPFEFSDVLANGSDGAVLPLDLQGGEVTITTGLVVWPGDTDNAPDPVTGFDVSAADLLPVGIYFGTTGPVRNGTYDPTWEPQPAEPWTPEAATYADATGTGEVEQNDVLPIGLNYGRTRVNATEPPASAVAASLASRPALRRAQPESRKAGAAKATSTPRRYSGSLATLTIEPQPVGTRIEVGLNVGTEEAPLSNVLGLHAQLLIPGVLDYVETNAGAFIDDGDLLRFDAFTPAFESSTSLLDAALSRKAGSAAASGAGRATRTAFDVVEEMTEPVTVEVITLRVSRPDGTIQPLTAETVTLEQIVTVDAEGDPESGLPTRVAIEAAYPNPFSTTSTIRYALPRAEPSAQLLVFDIVGRHVATLAQGPHEVGYHEATWDASRLASGTYFLRLVVGETIRHRRVTLLR